MAKRPKSSTIDAMRLFPGLLVLALVAVPAHAVLPDEIQVYTDDINAPGERGLELHINTTPSGGRARSFPNEVTAQHGLRVTPELTWGLTSTVDAGLYLPVTHDAEGRTLFGGPKFRLKWLPLKPGEDGTGWFAGLNWEYAILNRNFETATCTLELRPIIGWRGRDWLLAANPVVDWQLNGPERNGRPDFNPSIKVARTVAQGVALGLEYYAELGPLGRPLPGAQQAHTLYFAIETTRTPVPLHFAIGRGLKDDVDKWTVKAILEFSFGK
jgi:hypothetical protein